MPRDQKKVSLSDLNIREQLGSVSDTPIQKAGESLESLLTPRSLSLCNLSLDQIESSPFQARKMFSEVSLEELAESIKLHGVISRIRVRPHPQKKNMYQLVFGERRLRASRMLKLSSIPCEIGSYTDDELKEIGLVENLQRQDLDPLEEAEVFQQLLSQKGKSYSSYRTLAERLGKNKSYIEDRMALLKLPEDILQILREQPKVSLRALDEIGKIPTLEAREPLLKQLRTGRMSTEDVRTIVQEILELLRNSSSRKKTTDQVIFDHLFYKAARRMNSALAQLREAVTLYTEAPDIKKKEALSEYVRTLQREAKQVEDML